MLTILCLRFCQIFQKLFKRFFKMYIFFKIRKAFENSGFAVALAAICERVFVCPPGCPEAWVEMDVFHLDIVKLGNRIESHRITHRIT